MGASGRATPTQSASGRSTPAEHVDTEEVDGEESQNEGLEDVAKETPTVAEESVGVGADDITEANIAEGAVGTESTTEIMSGNDEENVAHTSDNEVVLVPEKLPAPSTGDTEKDSEEELELESDEEVSF